MTENSNNTAKQEHFAQVMQKHNDGELIEVLRNRRRYQPEAAQQAVLEAIRRGIIAVEADLLDEKFAEPNRKFSLFPVIENPKARSKARKSMARSLMVAGAIPAIYGIYQVYHSLIAEGVTIVLLGFSWMILSFFLLKSVKSWLIYGMLALYAVAFTVAVIKFSMSQITGLMDILFPSVLALLVLYGIIYLGRLKD
ncbi:MAG TPA: hypothetical protein DER09_12070 [Prolixibacteraceae bacterium]|nr:hypothetical protein [Prolixibacteraceae bacterium]